MRLIPALGLMTCVACGGGGEGPTATSGPPPPVSTPTPSGWPVGTTVQLVNGETGEAVQGTLIVAGVSIPAGSPLTSAATEGATVDVVVPGFLARQTLVRKGETSLVLWPDSAGLPGDYTRSLVYATVDSTGAPTLSPLRRLPTRVRTVAIVLSAALQGDPDAIAVHRAAIDGINAATAPLGLTYQLGGTADFSVPSTLDPSASGCVDNRLTRAYASLWLTNANEISRAEITYCGGAIADTLGTISHELGHTLGLRHSYDRNDMMYPYSVSLASTTPTMREARTFALMRARRPGTEWPDNDRTATAAARVRVETIVD